MTTPSTEEIYERAKQRVLEDSMRNGIEPISPTSEELRESGYTHRVEMSLCATKRTNS